MKIMIKNMKKIMIMIMEKGDGAAKKLKMLAGVIKSRKSSIPFPIDIFISLILCVLSALSLLIFHYMRNCEDAPSYYTSAGKSLIRDALAMDSFWVYLIVAVFLCLYYLAVRRKFRQGFRAGWFVSLPLAFNMIISLSVEHSNLREIFLPGDPFMIRVMVNLIIFIGFAALLSSVIAPLYCLLDFRTSKRTDLQAKPETLTKHFVLAYFIIFACWIPALVMCYPGSLDTEALGQIKGYMGAVRIDAANPMLSTLFYGWMFNQGRIYGNDVATIFKIVMIQDIFNAAFMALVSVRSYHYTKSKLAYFCTVIFFGLMPMWQRAAQHVLKDVLHTGWYLAFYVSYLNCLEKDHASGVDILLYCICCIAITFTRPAVFFIAIIATVVLLMIKKKINAKKFALCILIVVSLYTGVKNFIYPAFPKIIKPPREVENYSLQLQQVALYCIEYGDELSKDELRIINETLDYETVVKNYTPMTSDPVKRTWHGTDENHKEFWALYRKLLLRHPLTFLKGLLMSSFEHFNPWYSGNRNGVSMAKDSDFHQIEYTNMKNLQRMVQYWNSWLDHPVSRVFYGNGLYAWILIVMIGYVAKRRSLRAILGLVPHIALMIGMFMTHVNGLLRYGYPLIAGAPLICAYTYYAVSKEKMTLTDSPIVTIRNQPRLRAIAKRLLKPSEWKLHWPLEKR